jgi:hypothetical protein
MWIVAYVFIYLYFYIYDYFCYIFKFLPKGLEIGGYLSLTHSDIKSLPEGLKVGGNLIITDTPLAKLSDDELIEMIKPGFIEGEIYK